MNIDNIVNAIFKRKYLYVFSLYVLFFFLNNYIITFLEKFFLFQEGFSNSILDFLIICSSIILTLYLIYLAFFREYRTSFIQRVVVVAAILIPIYYYSISSTHKWVYLKDSHLGYEYIWYFLIPLSSFAILSYSLSIWRAIKGNKNKSDYTFNNYVVSDTPIYKQDKDLLDHSRIVNRLTTILLHDKHQKSISIGLVGPWGNGKSSVLNFVKEEIQKKIDFNNEIILLSFYPYLNHKQEDIISEFFTILSGELSKYSGKLSNQILSYTHKLTGLYKDKNITSFFDKHITKLDSTSAKQYYEEINDLLIELDKKIIVMVDDLDRLNDKEILQVLKLIRNTADFSNIIFVVAMDKDYTISILKSNKQILNANFLDKFFQFEVYLPEIDNSILRGQFDSFLSNSQLANDPNFIVKLRDGMNDDGNLFNDYVKNIRDVKRVVNQIIFDYPLLVDEINFKDFLNFTYFKLKFPKFMKLLNDNRLDYLKYDTVKKEYTLINTDSNKEVDSNSIKILGHVKYNDLEYLKGYDLYDKLIKEECLQENLSIDCKDLLLLLKTLVYLFGTKNNIENATSIRKVYNFRMLLQQRVFKDALLEKEFVALIKENKIIENIEIIDDLFRSNKITQLVDRFNYFNSELEKELDNAILILAYLYEKSFQFGLIEADVLRGLAVNVERKFDLRVKETTNTNVAKWIDKHLFEGDFLSSETKLLLLGNLWDARDYNVNYKFWKLDTLDPSYFQNKIPVLFEKYLERKPNLWEVNDFSFYRLYHSIKNVNNMYTSINKIVKDFWGDNDIELLCVQSTNFEAFSTTAFNLTDVLSEMFGSKIAFYEFVKNHKNNKDDKKSEIIEFLNLYKLMIISNFKIPILFSFGKSQLMLKKISLYKQNPNVSTYDEFKDWKQIFLSSNSKELIRTIFNYRNNKQEDYLINDRPYKPKTDIRALDVLQFLSFRNENLEYLVISYNKKLDTKYPALFLEAAIEISNLLYNEKKSSKITKSKITGDVKLYLTDEYYIQINSIQPTN